MPIVRPNQTVQYNAQPNDSARGGIVNPNGTVRRNAKPIIGELHPPGIVSAQHPTIGFFGRTYNSQFTTSAKPILNNTHNNSTQVSLPRLQVEAPGHVVKGNDFTKVHPTEKGNTFSVKPIGSRPVAFRAGGPSKHANVPTNPNKITVTPRRSYVPNTSSELPHHQPVNGSFLRSNAVLATHANHDIVSAGRWK